MRLPRFFLRGKSDPDFPIETRLELDGNATEIVNFIGEQCNGSTDNRCDEVQNTHSEIFAHKANFREKTEIEATDVPSGEVNTVELARPLFEEFRHAGYCPACEKDVVFIIDTPAAK